MKKLFILSMLLMGWLGVSAQSTRTVASPDPKTAAWQTFDQRFTQLKSTYQSGESQNLIGCQNLLLDSMRACMQEETRATVQKEMFDIFNEFAAFSLAQQPKTAVEAQFTAIQHFVEIAR
jgi:hypothetical protein